MHKIIAELRAAKGISRETIEAVEQLLEAQAARKADARARTRKWRAARDVTVTSPSSRDVTVQNTNEINKAVTLPPPLRSIQEEGRPSYTPVPPPDLQKDLFIRGEQVLGAKAGGLTKQLLMALGVELARARMETAATKGTPSLARSYVKGVLNAIAKDENRKPNWLNHVQL